MQNDNLTKLHITQSFRFGEEIASIANTIIQAYYPFDFTYIPFHGNSDVESKVSYEPLSNINCIICRTNKGVISETINMLDQSKSVHILGGTKPLSFLINSIYQLKLTGRTTHPDLFLFTSYVDLEEYAKSPMGGDLKPVLKLLATYGRERLLNILASTTQHAAKADITVTTAHKSKGLEWSCVRLANDFKVPSEESVPTKEETNILYVAASRALHHLDLSKCQATRHAAFSTAMRINKEKYQVDKATHQTSDKVPCEHLIELETDV